MRSALALPQGARLGGLLVSVVLVAGCPSAGGTLITSFDGPFVQTTALGALAAPPDGGCSIPGGRYDVSGDLDVIDLCLGVTRVEFEGDLPCGARSLRFVRVHVEIAPELCALDGLTADDAVVEVTVEGAAPVGRAEFTRLVAGFDGGCGNVEDIGVLLGPWDCADGTVDDASSDLNIGWNFPAPQRW